MIARRSIRSEDGTEIPGFREDPFVTATVRDLRLIADGRFTRLYEFRMGRGHYALKTLTSLHHINTLGSLREKRLGLEKIGFPAIHRINEADRYYIMDFVEGESVFRRVLRRRHRPGARGRRRRAAKALLDTASQVHARGWLLNDLSWDNFVMDGSRVRPVDPDRIRTIDEEADYLRRLDGKNIYTTPLFLSLAQCLNKVPLVADELQGIALMLDSLYNGDYLIGEYLETHGLSFSRRNQAMMLMSRYYPNSRKRKLPAPLRNPVEEILCGGQPTWTAEALSKLLG